MIEETLLGQYTNTHKQKELAACLFQPNIQTSREMILPYIGKIPSNLNILVQLFKNNEPIIDYLKFPTPIFIYDSLPIILAWSPRHPVHVKNYEKYSYWLIVWLRVNIGHLFAPNNKKINDFVNAHLPIIRYLDAQDDPNDQNIAQMEYKSVGKSYHDEDRNYIQITTESYPIRPYFLELIRKHFPNLAWEPHEVTKYSFKQNLKKLEESHTYFASLTIMEQCAEMYKQTSNVDLQDALYFYYASFLDYLEGHDNYPFCNAGFLAYDLPDVLHILFQIPLAGEQTNCEFLLGKFLQKSLPFAGARRTIVDKLDLALEKNEAFWEIVSKVIFCALANMYPHYLSPSTKRDFNMSKLIQIKKITSNREFLKHAFGDDSSNSYIVFTSFRMWILMTIHEQEHYLNLGIIDWKLFKEQTLNTVHIIQQSSFENETFSTLQTNLTDKTKQLKSKIYRYRNKNMIGKIYDNMINVLEKVIYKNCANISQIDEEIKLEILHHLIRVPKQEWMNLLCIKAITNIGDDNLYLMSKLQEVYYTTAKPKSFEAIIDLFTIKDFQILCWYMRIINTLNKIDFEILPLSMVKNIDHAMTTNKYILLPHTHITTDVYNVLFSICCGTIKTICGYREYGNTNVAYDIEKRLYLCSKIPKKIHEIKEDEEVFDMLEIDNERKKLRDKRKDFNHIPCKNNPVFSIPLRGYMLIMEKNTRYLHCPSCASFHQFKWTNFKQDYYTCDKCKISDYHFTCHICAKVVPEHIALKCNMIIFKPLALDGAYDSYQHLYFCKKHFRLEQINNPYVMF